MGLNVIMMGPPGAGKGTQAARFARERGLLKISTGDILRDAIQDGTPVGMIAKTKVDRGELVDDATMIEIVRLRLARQDAMYGFVLDGFPRTVFQARSLDTIMEERGNGALVIVDVRVPEDELVRRLAIRRICSNCGTGADPFGSAMTCRKCDGRLVQRVDDDKDVVLQRLKIYESTTRPVLEYYKARPTFRTVNGAQAPEIVASELDSMIDEACRASLA